MIAAENERLGRQKTPTAAPNAKLDAPNTPWKNAAIAIGSPLLL
jgi:hypothetical protein